MQDQSRECLPAPRKDFLPPTVLGTAALTTLAFAGTAPEALAGIVDRHQDRSAQAHDRAVLHQLGFRKAEGLAAQREALSRSDMFRIASRRPARLRVLCVMAPGDLMVNAPIDFLTAQLDVGVDLLYVRPGVPLPPTVPEHDVAFFAVSEAGPVEGARLASLYRRWMRPAINDPAHLELFARDRLARALADIAALCCAPTRRVAKAEMLPACEEIGLPVLVRPMGSHAGHGLEKVVDTQAGRAVLAASVAEDFYVTRFVDYAGVDGLYRKYRVVFIDRVAYLCHMAVSSHWMVHYLNAGMTESAEKRAEEAAAMATFEAGFGRRHAAAFDALHEIVGLEYYSIDCAELADGRLLVFEADSGAIIHAMDPPDLFPYKGPQMRRVFAAFGAMLRRVASGEQLAQAAGDLACQV